MSNQSEKLNILLVGIGGYGQNYVSQLLDSERDDYRIVGVVDPYPEGCKRLKELKTNGVPIFSSMEEFFEDGYADYAIISSPIQYHQKQTCLALEKGAGVLCEKPLSPTVKQGKEIIEAQKKADLPVGIGYQWSFNDAILDLKKDIMNGLLGEPLRFKTLVLWPRGFNYYSRNNWAGMKKDVNGNLVFDSVANNATAHYLHNMFFVLGDRIDSSAIPESVVAELYRANEIDNFDTAATRITTKGDVELLYLVSHAVDERYGPVFCYQFEKATVYYGQTDSNEIIAEFNDGRKKVYGNPFANRLKKTWVVLDAIKGEAEIPCKPETALSHVISIKEMQESVSEISQFPADLVKIKYDEDGNEEGLYVDGLFQTMKQCYQDWKLPDEKQLNWVEN